MTNGSKYGLFSANLYSFTTLFPGEDIEMELKTEFIPCVCTMLEHQIVLQLSDFGDDNFEPSNPEDCVHLEFSIFLHDAGNFWHRLWRAVRYVFGYKGQYGHWDGMAIDYKTASKMMETLQSYRNKVESYRHKATAARVRNASVNGQGSAVNQGTA